MDDRRRMPRKHIAVVNSSPDFLLLARDLFEEEGYHVMTSEFAPTVFTQIVMRQPDALLVDLAVGEPAGWDLLERLHVESATTDIPVLVTSTSHQLLEQVQDQEERYGPHRYSLVKPLDLDELAAAIRDLIARA
jgi:DNA-binding response OmpR family regulator